MSNSELVARPRRGLQQRRRAQRGPGSGPLRMLVQSRSRVLAEGLARLDREHFALVLATSREPTTGDRIDHQGEIETMLRKDLERTQRALLRAPAGRYGVCEHCDRPLPLLQIDHDPSATICHGCLRRNDGGVNLS